ncbi:MAG: NAD(P)H-hydrate dehydratase [Planctomycetota bacterium]
MTDALPALPARTVDGHKGTFGTVLVVGGQASSPRMMIGGPAFTALAALRSGCGLAVLALPEPILSEGLTIAPSATGLALPVDDDGHIRPSEAAQRIDDARGGVRCFAVGPGLGLGNAQQQLLVWLLARDDMPVVVDADGINNLATLEHALADVRAPAIFTPHPGEYARLAASLGIHLDGVDESTRVPAAEQLAQRLGAVVVLKGRHTVVSDGVRTVVNETGNAVLATAGTGDILTGIIAGLVAQFVHPLMAGGAPNALGLFECAQLGVHLHGVVADVWAATHGDAGLLATDLLDGLPTAMHALRAGSN